MGVVVLLIGFSLIVAIGFLVAFIWSVRSGQYEDDYSPSVRILFEDDPPAQTQSQDSNIEKKTPEETSQPKINK